jgi:hypothetical protein
MSSSRFDQITVWIGALVHLGHGLIIKWDIKVELNVQSRHVENDRAFEKSRDTVKCLPFPL